MFNSEGVDIENKVIGFTGEYVKLYKQTYGKLINIDYVSISQEDYKFISYDTLKEDGTYFHLENGNYTKLTFMGNFGIPFCTCRKLTIEEHNLLVNCLGYEFFIKRKRT